MPPPRPVAAAAGYVLAALTAAAGCLGPANPSASRTGDLSHGPGVRARPDAALVAACGPGRPTPAGDGRFQRHPYVQHPRPGAAAILWRATHAEPVVVEVSTPDGAPVARAPARREGARHFPDQKVAHLPDLPPGRTLCYRLLAPDGPLTEPAGFRTPPPPGAGEPVRFVVFGDSGVDAERQWRVRAQLDTVPFDLLLVVGDLAYGSGTPAQLERGFFRVYRDLIRSIPAFPVAGNHDYETDRGAPLREAFALPVNGGPGGEERWYSFDWGDVHFVGLDTEVMDERQAAWLDADLRGNRLPWVVVFAHRPPFSSGRHGSNTRFQRLFLPVLRAHRVPLLFAGHDHHYERTRPIDGLTTVVTGGGGHGTREVGASDFTAFAESVLHFVHVEVHGDHLILRAIDATGRVFDTARIDRDPRAPAGVP